MESLNRKTPISFAAAAGKNALAQPASTSPPPSSTTTTTSTSTGGATSGSGQPPTKNGANVPGSQSSSSQGSQSLSSSVPTSGTGVIKSTASASSGSIDWIVGLNVKVITQADDVFEGQVYAYDVIMNCIVLHIILVVKKCQSKTTSTATIPATYYSQSLGGNSSAPRPKYDFRILKINHIKEVVPLSTTAARSVNETELSEEGKTNAGVNNSISTTSNVFSTALPVVGYVQLDKIQQREQQAVREVQAAAARIGVGVTSIAQDIFDALSKTLPCRWAKDSIVVMDEVIISPPYEPENCKANPSSSNSLARVKKVLEGERMRLANGRK